MHPYGGRFACVTEPQAATCFRPCWLSGRRQLGTADLLSLDGSLGHWFMSDQGAIASATTCDAGATLSSTRVCLLSNHLGLRFCAGNVVFKLAARQHEQHTRTPFHCQGQRHACTGHISQAAMLSVHGGPDPLNRNRLHRGSRCIHGMMSLSVDQAGTVQLQWAHAQCNTKMYTFLSQLCLKTPKCLSSVANVRFSTAAFKIQQAALSSVPMVIWLPYFHQTRALCSILVLRLHSTRGRLSLPCGVSFSARDRHQNWSVQVTLMRSPPGEQWPSTWRKWRLGNKLK